MDEFAERELLREAARQYSIGGMAGFENWVGTYSGSTENTEYYRKLRKVLEERNNNGGLTRVDSLHLYTSLNQIIDEGIKLSSNGLQEKLLKLKFNIPDQQS